MYKVYIKCIGDYIYLYTTVQSPEAYSPRLRIASGVSQSGKIY